MLPVAPGRVDNWVESGDGESGIERDTEKAGWKKEKKKQKKNKPLQDGFLFFLPSLVILPCCS